MLRTLGSVLTPSSRRALMSSSMMATEEAYPCDEPRSKGGRKKQPRPSRLGMRMASALSVSAVVVGVP